jgi:hypothetical protein
MAERERVRRGGRWLVVALLLAVLATLVPGTAVDAASTGTIRGTVTDANGDPVADVQVLALGDGFYSNITDASGKYTLTVTPGSYQMGFYPPPDSGLLSFEYPTGVTVAAGATRVIDVVLSEAGSVEGTVTGPGGVLLPTVDVIIESDVDAALDRTDVNGHYSLTGLRPGPHALGVVPPPTYGLAPTFVYPVEVVSGEVVDLDVELVAGGTIAGVVTGPGDVPLPGVEIEVFGEAASGFTTTNLDGEYSVEGLPAGTYDLTFLAPRGRTSFRRTSPGRCRSRRVPSRPSMSRWSWVGASAVRSTCRPESPPSRTSSSSPSAPTGWVPRWSTRTAPTPSSRSPRTTTSWPSTRTGPRASSLSSTTAR